MSNHTVQEAYQKLKSYVYYDNFNLQLRAQIAEFETNGDITEKLNILAEKVRQILTSDEISTEELFSEELEQIKISFLPKKLIYSGDDNGIFSNNTGRHPEIGRVTKLINAPIELHIISVLWLLEDGKHLTKNLTHNYGYQLAVQENNVDIVPGKRLYKPYFEYYQEWRDKGLRTAKKLIEEQADVLMIGLDVKEYFPNIDLKFSLLKADIDTPTRLTDILEAIHTRYSELPDSKNSGIPIGLLSSGVIGNWYLKEFDQAILANSNPAYYGRYVDDIFIIIPNPSQQDINSKKGALLAKYTRGVLKETNGHIIIDKPVADTSKHNYSKIIFNQDKVTVHYFNHSWPLALLNNFEKRLKENSSAFWFLPNEENLSESFDEHAFDLIYSDTINKFRSVKEINQSKYGASIFLAKRIKLAILNDHLPDKTIRDQILIFFKGVNSIELYGLWEKVMTYFIVTRDETGIKEFMINTLHLIQNSKGENHEKVQLFLGSHLNSAFALAGALDIEFYKEIADWLKKTDNIKPAPFNMNPNLCKSYRKSFLVRHHYLLFPFLSITNYALSDSNKLSISNLDLDGLSNKKKESELQLRVDCNRDNINLIPRYIYLEEVSLLAMYNSILNWDGDEKENPFGEKHFTFINETWTKLNQNGSNHLPPVALNNIDKDNSQCITIKFNTETESLAEITLENEDKLNSKVGVANLKISQENILNAIQGNPNQSPERRRELLKILNKATEEKVDFLILQENSIPSNWTIQVSDDSRRKDRIFIGGLEHITCNGICFNIAIAVLPFEYQGLKDAIIVPRVKNHYSPNEQKVIRGHFLRIPSFTPAAYHIINSKGMQFSVFNCYELADIRHRSLLRAQIDTLFAIEYNKDVNYFSNIVESVSRDIHCYVVQANTSDFGDTRVTQPTQTIEKDKLRIKGGENSVVLTTTLDIQKLRNFQSTSVDYQTDTLHDQFKSTPPNFDHEAPRNR